MNKIYLLVLVLLGMSLFSCKDDKTEYPVTLDRLTTIRLSDMKVYTAGGEITDRAEVNRFLAKYYPFDEEDILTWVKEFSIQFLSETKAIVSGFSADITREDGRTVFRANGETSPFPGYCFDGECAKPSVFTKTHPLVNKIFKYKTEAYYKPFGYEYWYVSRPIWVGITTFSEVDLSMVYCIMVSGKDENNVELYSGYQSNEIDEQGLAQLTKADTVAFSKLKFRIR